MVHCTYLGVDVGNLLYRAALSTSTMARRHDAAIGALAEFLDKFVLCIDHKCRIQGGKRSSGHVRGSICGTNEEDPPADLWISGFVGGGAGERPSPPHLTYVSRDLDADVTEAVEQ